MWQGNTKSFLQLSHIYAAPGKSTVSETSEDLGFQEIQNYIDKWLCPLILRPHDNNAIITNNSQLSIVIQNGKSYASLKKLVTAQMRLCFNLLTSVEIQSNPSDFNRAPKDWHSSTGDIRNWLIVLSIILTVKSLSNTQNYQIVAEKSVGCFCCSE